jgi:broad specificity phosphatase PhoE
MNAPRVSRSRRSAFLAPVWLGAVAALLAVLALAWAWRSQVTTTVLLVRHAEQEPAPAADPPLSETGRARAARLAALLGEPDPAGRPVAILVSDTRRSAETAAPLAGRLGVNPEVIPGGDPAATVRAIFERHRGETVIVVGHANTVPSIAARLIGTELAEPVGVGEFDLLYVLSLPRFGPPTTLRLRY